MKTLPKLLFMILFIELSAQSIDKRVIATSGTTFNSSPTKLTFTLGEPIIGTIDNTETIDQGFLSSVNSGTLSIEDELVNKSIKIFPNPVSEYLNIDLNNINGDAILNLYSITGKFILKAKLNRLQNKVNLNTLESGTYLIKLHFLEHKKEKTFKIIKK